MASVHNSTIDPHKIVNMHNKNKGKQNIERHFHHRVAEALFICCLIELCAGVYYQEIAFTNRRWCVLSGDCVDSVTARDDFFRLFLNCERFKVPTILEYDNLRQIRAFIYLVVGLCGDLLNVGLEGGLGH